MTAIRQYLESHKEEMIDFLAELVAVRSVKGEASEDFPFGKNTATVLGMMLQKCREYGFITENNDNYMGTADFCNDGEPELAILSHLDIVPEGHGWRSDPFVLVRSKGKLIGRGTCDDKGPAVASLFALRAVKELNIPLKKGVRLIFGTDEENGSSDLRHYCKSHKMPPMVFTPDGEYPVINGEKGMLRVRFSADFDYDIEISAGEVVNAVPQYCNVTWHGSEKELYEGKAAHASTPEKGVNAITKFLDLNVRNGVNNPVFEVLTEIFPHDDIYGTAIFGDIQGITCVLSLLNTFNGKIVGTVDIRFPIGQTKKHIGDVICNRLKECGFDIVSCNGTEPHYTDENSDFIKSLFKAYEKVTGEKGYCISIGGGTYVHEINGGVAFGAVFPNEDCHMHSKDEFMTEENFLKNAEIMAEAIIELCG